MEKYSVADVANQYVEYDMIQAHTAIPSYSELRLQLLHAVLYQSTQVKQKSELFSVVTALVQLGMDTHDMIDTETEYLSETKMRSRQLRVLAGDYFSARFYHLLAKAGEIDLIGKLSKAVANVNRHKIALYEKAKTSLILADEYMHERIHINSELFKQFNDYVDKALQPTWQALLPLVTQFECLIDELERKTLSEGYAKSYAYWSVLEQLQTAKQDYISEELLKSYAEQFNINKLLIDKLHTTMYQIKEVVNKDTRVQLQLQLVIEQLNEKLSKFVVK